MEINQELLDQIEVYGSRNYPVSYILQLECRTIEEREFLKAEFANPLSEVNNAWKKGYVTHESQVDEYLEQALENPGEGAHDVAKALHFRRKNRDLDEMINEMFGV